MRKSGFVSGLFAGLLVAVVTFAGEVNLPHTFQPNTKAKASEVNANFEAVRNAVNDNNNRIQSLENTVSDHGTRLQDLESFQSNIQGQSCSSGFVSGFGPGGTLQCSANKYRSITILGSACYPGTPNQHFGRGHFLYPLSTSSTSSISAYCNIPLPEGSIVRQVKLSLYDDFSSGNGYVRYDVKLVKPFNISSSPPIPNSTTLGSGGTNDWGKPGHVVETINLNQPISRGDSLLIQITFGDISAGIYLAFLGATIIYEFDPSYTGSAP